MGEQKKKRVRIAVVVGTDGRWSAVGFSKYGSAEPADDTEFIRLAAEHVEMDWHEMQVTWVEADVFFPAKEETVEPVAVTVE
jgi:hypothetical protein